MRYKILLAAITITLSSFSQRSAATISEQEQSKNSTIAVAPNHQKGKFARRLQEQKIDMFSKISLNKDETVKKSDNGLGVVGWILIVIGFLVLLFASILLGILVMLAGLIFVLSGKKKSA